MLIRLPIILTVIIATITVALAWHITPSKRKNTLLVASAIVLYLLPQTQASLPVDTRLPAIVIIATLFLRHFSERSLLSLETSFPLLLPAAWLFTSTIWSTGAASYVASQVFLGLGLVLACLAIAQRAEALRTGLAAAFIILVVATAAITIFSPQSSLLGGRLRGPLANPNTLGAALPLLAPAAANTCKRFRFPLWAITILMAWQTGSRAALLALAIQVTAACWSKMAPMTRAGAALATPVIAAYALPTLRSDSTNAGAGDASVLRANNSRDTVWAYSSELAHLNPVRGQGFASYDSRFETGSSFYAVWIQGGSIGIALIALAIVYSLLRSKSYSDWRLITMAGGIINAIFEGWLIAPGSVMCLIFWMCAASLADSHHVRRPVNVDRSSTRSSSYVKLSPRNARRRTSSVHRRSSTSRSG